MATETTTLATMGTAIITLILVWASKVTSTIPSPPSGRQQLVPSILVFGGSAMDTGNNNFLNRTLFKANFLPYGIDSPSQIPTGRFSNGKIGADFIASLLGLKNTVPPFLDPNLSDNDLITGVSFASAGAGFDGFAASASEAMPFVSQLNSFSKYIDRLSMIIGRDNAERVIAKSLALVCAGSLDWAVNYFHGVKVVPRLTNFLGMLMNNIRSFIWQLHNNGLRKIAVGGLPPMGCVPIENSGLAKGCREVQNDDARYFNQHLQDLLQKLQPTLRNATLFYVDVYTPLLDMINYPQNYGFVETRKTCCTTGIIQCLKDAGICSNRSEYLFWDKMHLTEAANRHLYNSIFQHSILPILNQSDPSPTTLSRFRP